ncbi:MAG: glycosyltransferase family 4 protein [Proteobacteria bacterium]|nr:glycosyltransferase family 4 protein [Pseudomonadota bacterium]
MTGFNFTFAEIFRFDAAVAGIVSFGLCVLLVVTKQWHGALSMDSSEGVQKIHTAPTPRIGGVAIAVGVLMGFAVSSHDPLASEKRAILSGIILAGIPAFVFGLLEDLTKQVSVRARLLATIGSGVLGWGITGISLTHLGIPGVDRLLGFTVVSVLFTAFAVGGIANAINIIDGFNGLASGSVLIMLAALGIIAREVGDIPLAFSSLLIAGAVAGFWIVNWPLGKIFLGDGGAYFVGFALGWIAVLLPQRNPSVSPWTSLLTCAYPVLEVVASYVRRARREGQTPGEPDRVHLHHLIHGRLVRRLFARCPRTWHNALTAPFGWVMAAIPAGAALITLHHPVHSVAALVLFILIYMAFYRRLAKFGWL